MRANQTGRKRLPRNSITEAAEVVKDASKNAIIDKKLRMKLRNERLVDETFSWINDISEVDGVKKKTFCVKTFMVHSINEKLSERDLDTISSFEEISNVKEKLSASEFKKIKRLAFFTWLLSGQGKRKQKFDELPEILEASSGTLTKWNDETDSIEVAKILDTRLRGPKVLLMYYKTRLNLVAEGEPRSLEWLGNRLKPVQKTKESDPAFAELMEKNAQS